MRGVPSAVRSGSGVGVDVGAGVAVATGSGKGVLVGSTMLSERPAPVPGTQAMHATLTIKTDSARAREPERRLVSEME